MPAVRTVPRDVLIRVPKVEPYSNSYIPPSVRAKEEAKKAAEAQAGTSTSAAGAEAGPSTSISADPLNPTLASQATSADATNTIALPTSTTDAATTTASASTEATAPAAPQPEGADANKPEGQQEPKDQRERGNSPTLPFLSVEREEEQTVELSKAATSAAGWNSLLVWARRQRGAQWDESTVIWQVDKGSKEYYSFCEDPATTDRSKQPGDQEDPSANKEDVAAAEKAAEDDEDKGPTRVSSRNKVEGEASPPPVAVGRSARLLRR